MPWKKMRLRDADVLARVDEMGEPVARSGRVEVRYGPRSPKAYHASAANLSAIAGAPLLPDEHCVDVAAEPPAKGPRTAKRAQTPTEDEEETPTTTVAAGTVIVYADGACSGNPGPAGLGVVLIDGPHRVELSEYLGTGTNNIAELTAIQRALELVPDHGRPIVMHTDSQYSIGVLSKGWKAKANQELIGELRRMLTGRTDVRFVYVRGHAGVVLNERADQLARQAIETRRTVEQEYRSSTPGSKVDPAPGAARRKAAEKP